MSKIRHTAEDENHFIVRSVAAIGCNGRSIAPHAHPWHQLIYSTAGVMTVCADPGSWIVPPTWAIWAPAGIAHSISFSGQTVLRTLYLRPQEWSGLPESSCVIAVSPLLRELIVRAVEIGMLDRRDPIHRSLAVLVVDSLCEQSVPAFDLPMPVDAALMKIARHIMDVPGDRAAVAVLAQRFGLVTRTLERRFLAETGMPLGQWRRLARMTHALRHLAAGKAIKIVALDVGYQSASAFVASFNDMFQQTPARYFTSTRGAGREAQ
jgi:AraC-like DNA-binding protein